MSKFRGMPSFGGGMNINKLMKEAQKMQAELQNTQKNLENKVYNTSVGGGVLKLEMNGRKEILNLELDESVVDPDDVETLVDLIKLAFNELSNKIDSEAKESMEGFNIPGL